MVSRGVLSMLVVLDLVAGAGAGWLSRPEDPVRGRRPSRRDSSQDSGSLPAGRTWTSSITPRSNTTSPRSRRVVIRRRPRGWPFRETFPIAANGPPGLTPSLLGFSSAVTTPNASGSSPTRSITGKVRRITSASLAGICRAAAERTLGRDRGHARENQEASPLDGDDRPGARGTRAGGHP